MSLKVEESNEEASEYNSRSPTRNIDKFKTNKLKKLKQSTIYKPFIYKSDEIYPNGLFESTANFFFDLVELSKKLVKLNVANRKEELSSYLR